MRAIIFSVIKMIIKGFQKLTLLDFPGHTACTVFTAGCNLRCPFCHNALLVTENNDASFSEDEIFSYLEKRDIERFLYEIKDRGFKVKLDTNGCYPEKLEGILQLGLADYVAMDVKNCPGRYAETVGVADFDLRPVEKSMGLLRDGGIPYEFRTTVTENFHRLEDIEALAEWIKGAPLYFLQNFVDSGNLIDSSCKGVSREKMREMLQAAKKYVPAAELRGI